MLRLQCLGMLVTQQPALCFEDWREKPRRLVSPTSVPVHEGQTVHRVQRFGVLPTQLAGSSFRRLLHSLAIRRCDNLLSNLSLSTFRICLIWSLFADIPPSLSREVRMRDRSSEE